MNRLLIPACFLMVACTKTDSPKAAQASISRAAVLPVALTSAENPVDSTISDRVRDALLADGTIRREMGNVHVTTKDGVVTLSGSVRNDAIARRMVTVAQSVGSVVRVDNELVIDPNAPTGGTLEGTMDHVISDRVRYALQEDMSLGRDVANIDVTTKDGVVTLTGTVSNVTAKQRADVVANAVGSVVRVNNELVVKLD